LGVQCIHERWIGCFSMREYSVTLLEENDLIFLQQSLFAVDGKDAITKTWSKFKTDNPLYIHRYYNCFFTAVTFYDQNPTSKAVWTIFTDKLANIKELSLVPLTNMLS